MSQNVNSQAFPYIREWEQAVRANHSRENICSLAQKAAGGNEKSLHWAFVVPHCDRFSARVVGSPF